MNNILLNINPMTKEFNDFLLKYKDFYEIICLEKMKDFKLNNKKFTMKYSMETHISDNDREETIKKNIDKIEEQELIMLDTNEFENILFSIVDHKYIEEESCEICGIHPSAIDTIYQVERDYTEEEIIKNVSLHIKPRQDLYDYITITVDKENELFNININIKSKSILLDVVLKTNKDTKFSDVFFQFNKKKNNLNIKTQFSFLNSKYNKYFSI